MWVKKTGGALLAVVLLAGCTDPNGAAPPSASVSVSVQPTPSSAAVPSTSTSPTPSQSPTQAYTYDPKHCGVMPRAQGQPSQVLLTIDDFPYENGEIMVQVAEWAQRTNTMMHAFPVANYVTGYNQKHHTDLVDRTRALGTYVSNHTYSHADLTMVGPGTAKKEIVNGVTSTYVRPPYGAYNDAITKLITQLGAKVCHWTIDTGDWMRDQQGHYPSAETLVSRVRTQLKGIAPGSPVVILGHYQTSYPRALQAIRDEVVRAGLQVCPAPSTPSTAEVPYPLC